jgi:hypothetical protein
MEDSQFPTSLTAAATALVDIIALVEPSHRAVVLVFDPLDGQHQVYSNASEYDLAPILRLVVARLRDGTLRMPVAGGVRWVDVGER